MMTAKVIQGSFLSGEPKLAAVKPRISAPPIQTKTGVRPPAPGFTSRPPGPPTPAFAIRPPGPPAPAFAARPAALQRHGSGGAFAVEAGPLGLASAGGKPLPDGVRGKMEAALGANFADVRVHVGPQAERIGAIAFTVGSDIYFAPGRYQPDTPHGQQLLGHELAHVVQQRAGRVRNPLGSELAVVQDHALEAEADRLGRHAAAHRVAAQAKMPPGAAQPASPVRISPPVSAGPGSYRLTAGAGGRQLGSVMVHARDKGAVEVTDLHVAEAQRGNGIGRMLLASAARTGQQFGRSKVSLAAQDNGSGHLTQWYKGIGFAQVGVNHRGYPQLEAPISRVLAGTVQRREAGFVSAFLGNILPVSPVRQTAPVPRIGIGAPPAFWPKGIAQPKSRSHSIVLAAGPVPAYRPLAAAPARVPPTRAPAGLRPAGVVLQRMDDGAYVPPWEKPKKKQRRFNFLTQTPENVIRATAHQAVHFDTTRFNAVYTCRNCQYWLAYEDKSGVFHLTNYVYMSKTGNLHNNERALHLDHYPERWADRLIRHKNEGWTYDEQRTDYQDESKLRAICRNCNESHQFEYSDISDYDSSDDDFDPERTPKHEVTYNTGGWSGWRDPTWLSGF